MRSISGKIAGSKMVLIGILAMGFFIHTKTSAQSFTGPEQVCADAYNSYSYFDDVEYTTATWSVTGGGTIISGSGLNRTIAWSSSGTVTVILKYSGLTVSQGTKYVDVSTPGSISGSMQVCSGTTVSLTRNGSIGSSFTWQYKPQGAGSWTNFGSGGLTASYTVTQNTDFRVVLNDCATGNISPTSTVSVYAPVTGGTINAGVSQICSGSSPGMISNTATPTSGGASILWQKSTDGGSIWSDISTAWNLEYDPGVLTQSTQFRRRVIGCGSTTYSNVVSIQVDPTTSAGTLSYSNASALCTSGTVNLNFGANPVGAVTNWFVRSKDGAGAWSGWTSFSTANQLTNSYSVSSGAGVDRTYEFYITAKSGVCSEVSGNTVSVVVNPTTSAGTLSYSSASVMCASGTVNLNFSANPVGAVTNWFVRSKDGAGAWSGWTSFSTANTLTYAYGVSSGAVDRTYEFYINAKSGTCSEVSGNTVSVLVNPATSAGTLSYSSASTMCSSGTVNLNFSANPVGVITNWFVRSKDGAGAWSGWTSFSTANQLTNSYGVSSGAGVDRTYEFYITAKSGVCAEISGTSVSMVVNTGSSAGSLSYSSASSMCTSGTVNLNFSANPVGAVTNWFVRSKDGAGAWSGWTSFSTSNQLTNSYSVASGTGVVRTYEFYVNVKNGTCTEVSGTSVSMIVNPATTSGTLSYTSASVMCASGTVNLNFTANPVGTVTNWHVRSKDGAGAWSAWTVFSTANALVNSYPVTTVAGVVRTYEFYVKVQSGNCLEVSGSSVSMTVNPSSSGGTLTITGATEWYSISGSNTLSSTGTVGTVSYESSADGTTWVSSANPVTLLTVTKQFRVKAVSGTCAAAYSPIKTISVYPTPSITMTGPSAIPVGGSTLLSTQTTYTSYQWMKDNIDIATATSYNYTVTQPGSYIVKVKGSSTAAWTSAIAVNVGSSLLSQPQQINYLVVTNLFKEGATTSTNFYSLNSNEVRQSVTYMDGFGRTVQQNAIGQSPGRKDLVQPYKYDFDGRQEYSYLPYASTQIDGKYVIDPFPTQLSFYQSLPGVQADSYPYAKSVFDNSPLSRVLEQGAPGTDWQPGSTHTVRQVFNTNVAAYTDAALKNVRKWTTAGHSGTYADNQLGIATTTDENGNKVWTFSDNLGRIVLKRVQLDETLKLNASNIVTPFLETYYVYDNRGNLAIQVPPKASAFINNGTAWSTAFRDQWCFVYTYDERNRLVEKKVPDAAVVYYAYDKLDRLVLTQDGFLRGDSSKWMFIKYDIKGRPIMTGIYKNQTHLTRTAIQTTFLDTLYNVGLWYEDRVNVLHGYTNRTFPKTQYGGAPIRVFSINYYDNYDFDNNGTADQSYTALGIAGEGTQFRTFDLPTGSKRLVIGAAKWLYNYVFYDKYGRVIQVRSNNHLSATVDNLATNIYDFEGKLLQSVQYHTNGTTPVTVVRKMNYDHAGRLTKVSQKIDALAEVALAQYEYNEMGQLLDKKLLGPDDSYLQSIDYTYNIRGWLKGINDTQMINSSATNDNNDLFGLELAYNNVITGLNDQAGDSRYYNGNISASRWRMKVDATAQYDDQKGYKFNYDKADRLKTAKYRGYKNSAWTHEQDIYNESMTYDHNGNMITLQRNRAKRGTSAFAVISEQIDNLTYTYASGSGNKLTKVEDATAITAGFKNGVNVTAEYTYNTNGSMNADLNKGISGTTYNELGKPIQITFSDGRKIVYTYDGAGTKLTVKNYNGATLLSTTDYVDGYVYENSVLNFFGSPEGRVVKSGGNYEYQFAIGDNQNNTRLLYGKAFEGSNLLATQAECTTTSGFAANGTVTITAVTLNSETYVKGVAGQTTSTPGIFPIGGIITVQPGAKYTFKVKGYSEGSDAWLYITGNAGDLVWKGTVMAKGATAETWHSNEIVIPTGVTQLRVGVLWSTPTLTLGSAIYLNKVGLYKHNDDDYAAGFEAANTTTEDNDFQSYYTAKINNSAVYARTGTSSYRLTASSSIANEIIGPAKSLRVYTGDVIKMEAYARYLAPTSTSSGVAAAIATALNAAFGNVAGGGTDAAFQSINSLFTAGPLIGTATFPADNTTAPKAYLNYILFDDNFVPYDFGYDQVGEAGALPGGVADKMALEAKVRKPGYLYIYLSNENPTIAEVYFDDLNIKHVKSPVIQYNDYYAYGLQTGNSWTRDNTKNNFLYNEGTELNPNSGLYDLVYRNFDPVLGRLTQVDPMADKYSSHSTFNYAFNDPITLNDPSGADPYPSSSAKENYTSVMNDMFGESWRDRGLVLDAGTRNGGSSFAKGGTSVSKGPSLDEYENQRAGIKGEQIALNWIRNYLGIDNANAGELYQNGLTVWAIMPNAYFEGKEGNTYEIHLDGFFNVVSAKKVKQGETPTPWHFLDGFLDPRMAGGQETDFIKTDFAVGTGWSSVVQVGHYNAKMQAYNYTSTRLQFATELRAAKYLNWGAKGLGVTGALVGGIQSSLDGTLTIGEFTKTAFSAAMVFTGPIGIIYTVADIYVGYSTGYSITDRIGLGIDYSINK